MPVSYCKNIYNLNIAFFTYYNISEIYSISTVFKLQYHNYFTLQQQPYI